MLHETRESGWFRDDKRKLGAQHRAEMNTILRSMPPTRYEGQRAVQASPRVQTAHQSSAPASAFATSSSTTARTFGTRCLVLGHTA